jgi:hypothetical protein
MFPEVSVPELPHPFIRTRDLFRVENDLELVGPLSVSGEWQGARTEGQWVRSNERITLTGPIVVYEGTTDVFPPSGAFTDVLQDDDGDFVTTAHSSGAVVNLTIAADGTTDLDENYTLTLQDLPGTATLVKQRRIHLRVDGDAPAFRNAVPEPDDWHGSSEVLVSITADDHATSGVVGSTLEYSYTTTGASGAWTEWSREGLTVTPDGGDVDGLVTLALPDGTENFVRWRAGDRVGNGPSVSDAFRIKVDTKNVTFRRGQPDAARERAARARGVPAQLRAVARHRHRGQRLHYVPALPRAGRRHTHRVLRLHAARERVADVEGRHGPGQRL